MNTYMQVAINGFFSACGSFIASWFVLRHVEAAMKKSKEKRDNAGDVK